MSNQNNRQCTHDGCDECGSSSPHRRPHKASGTYWLHQEGVLISDCSAQWNCKKEEYEYTALYGEIDITIDDLHDFIDVNSGICGCQPEGHGNSQSSAGQHFELVLSWQVKNPKIVIDVYELGTKIYLHSFFVILENLEELAYIYRMNKRGEI